MPSSALHHHHRLGREHARGDQGLERAPDLARGIGRIEQHEIEAHALAPESLDAAHRVAGAGCGRSSSAPSAARFARSTARLRGACSTNTTSRAPREIASIPSAPVPAYKIEHARAVQITEACEQRDAHAIRGRTRAGRRRAQAPAAEPASRHAHVDPLSRIARGARSRPGPRAGAVRGILPTAARFVGCDRAARHFAAAALLKRVAVSTLPLLSGHRKLFRAPRDQKDRNPAYPLLTRTPSPQATCDSAVNSSPDGEGGCAPPGTHIKRRKKHGLSCSISPQAEASGETRPGARDALPAPVRARPRCLPAERQPLRERHHPAHGLPDHARDARRESRSTGSCSARAR